MAQEQHTNILDELRFMIKKDVIIKNYVFNETLSLSVLKKFYLPPSPCSVLFFPWEKCCTITSHHRLVPGCKDEVAYANDSMYSVFNGQLHSNIIQC